MKQIELTQGRVALVDDEDFEWLSQWKWCYKRRRKTGYAVRKGQQTIQMHVEILKRYQCFGRGKEVDHFNLCGCDNRKENLRLTPSSVNGIHSGTGASWCEANDEWRARIRINKKRKYSDYFVSEEAAVAARQQAEIEYLREFRCDPTNVCPLGKTGECPDCVARLKELSTMYCWSVRMAWQRPTSEHETWCRSTPEPRHNTSALFRVTAPTIQDAIAIAEADHLPPNCSDPVVWSVAIVRSVAPPETESGVVEA